MIARARLTYSSFSDLPKGCLDKGFIIEGYDMDNFTETNKNWCQVHKNFFLSH